jgi:hypothetical protein
MVRKGSPVRVRSWAYSLGGLPTTPCVRVVQTLTQSARRSRLACRNRAREISGCCGGVSQCTRAPGASATAAAYSERSVGTPQQVAWVRQAAHRFVTAELAADGSGACAVLDARLRVTAHGRSCGQRWNSRLLRMLRQPGVRSQLRSELHAVTSGRVVVRGNVASIELPAPLLHGPNRFLWTENCWMLEG